VWWSSSWCCRSFGQHITELIPSRGFAAEFGAATTVLVCSRLGLPISTTHTLVGAVIGVALARGMAALNARAVRSIVNSWLITLPFTALLTMVIYALFAWLG
jgi:PiT family inorganic phosphate transporter